MTTKIRGKEWQIIVQEDGLFQVQTRMGLYDKIEKIKDIPTLEEAISRLVRELDICDSQLRTTQMIRAGVSGCLKGDTWRVVKQDDIYTVQVRTHKGMKWSHGSVETVASYGNIEGALLHLAESFRASKAAQSFL